MKKLILLRRIFNSLFYIILFNYGCNDLEQINPEIPKIKDVKSLKTSLPIRVSSKYQIVFTRLDIHGNWQIYTVAQDGSNQINLSQSTASDNVGSRGIAVSPDGKRILFTSNREDDNQIWIMNIDGTEQTRLTFLGSNNHCPGWAPDSKKFVFTSNRDGNDEVYLMNLNDLSEINLTNSLAWESMGKWSPDGKKIIFYSNRDDDNEIYMTSPDGTFLKRITESPGSDTMAKWLSDSKRIIYKGGLDNFQIFLTDINNTSPPVQLTFNSLSDDFFPMPSLDDKKFVFNRNGALMIMNMDGSGSPTMLSDMQYQSYAYWAQHGNKARIIYSKTMDEGTNDIFIINEDGSSQVKLTNDPSDDIDINISVVRLKVR